MAACIILLLLAPQLRQLLAVDVGTYTCPRHTGCKVVTDVRRVACLMCVCVFFSMEALSLIQQVSLMSKASSEIVYVNELIKD